MKLKKESFLYQTCNKFNQIITDSPSESLKTVCEFLACLTILTGYILMVIFLSVIWYVDYHLITDLKIIGSGLFFVFILLGIVVLLALLDKYARKKRLSWNNLKLA